MNRLKQRARNCLLGGLVGDALGGRYEFDKIGLLQHDYRKHRQSVAKKSSRKVFPLLGGGVWRLVPGQVTDDSEMMLALAQALIRSKCIDAKTIAQEYTAWYNSKPFDIGKATQIALRVGPDMDAVRKAAISYNETCMDTIGDHNLSNGMLMRVAPIAIVCAVNLYKSWLCSAFDLRTVERAVAQDTMLTHASRAALCYSTAYVWLLTAALIDGSMDRAIVLLLRDQRMQMTCNCDWYERFTAGLDPDARLAHAPTEMIGDVRIAFQLAVRKARMVQNGSMTFQEALLSTARLGGDTDTNCCIVGYLCAAVSRCNPIADEWMTTIVSAVDRSDRATNHPPLLWIKSISSLVEHLTTVNILEKK